MILYVQLNVELPKGESGMSKQESCDFGHVTFVWDCDDCKFRMMRLT